jgi:membrane fusion protein (multidrug efflux system)
MHNPLCKVTVAALAIYLVGSPWVTNDLAEAQSKEPLPAVVVAPVTMRPVASSAEFIGQTEAYRKVDIRARVTGTLLSREFTEGSDVKTGDLLYKIDQAEYVAQRDAAAAKVQRAEATIREAERKYKRYETLEARGSASTAALDEATAQVGEARADLAAAKAELERAKINLGYTEISSPIDGRIGRSAINVGNLVGPNSGVLATVVTLDPIRVLFTVSEREYIEYRKRTAAGDSEPVAPKIRLADGSEYSLAGKIDFIDNRVDPDTGTLRLRAVFDNPDRLILPGQFVNIILVSEKPQNRIVVPQAAVQQNQAGPFVLVVDGDGTVSARTIKTGSRQGRDVVVTEGLTEGEQIIVEGIQKTRPGAKVRPVPVGG